MDNKELEARIEELELRIARSKAFVEIANLQARFNYYLEANLTDRVIELFSEKDPDVSCEVFDTGIYKGIDAIKNFWNARYDIQAERGTMMNLMLKSPFIKVSEDGKSAKAFWHVLGADALYATPYPCDEEKLTAAWLVGRFYNEYILEDGKWKIKKLTLMPYIITPFEQGWVKQSDCYRFAPDPRVCKPSSTNKKMYTYHPHGDANEFLSLLPKPM